MEIHAGVKLLPKRKKKAVNLLNGLTASSRFRHAVPENANLQKSMLQESL
jgi:hypothetical protein